MPQQYLYGSSIRGIQRFIFETNRLREVVGASEIVERLSGALFDSFLAEGGFSSADCSFIVRAAGNIRFTAQNRALVEYAVRNFPMFAQRTAPGITVAQAAEAFDGSLSAETSGRLEQGLRTQQNRLQAPSLVSPMAAVRSRRTGKPAVDWKDEDAPRDAGVKRKQEFGMGTAPGTLMEKMFSSGDKEKYPFDVEDICSGSSSWLAVIHADGNSLGKVIQGLSAAGGESSGLFREFSEALNRSTCAAARTAAEKTVLPAMNEKGRKKYPVRPVILGGDDLTVIIRADLAVDFTMEYLRAFGDETKKNLKGLAERTGMKSLEDGLSACAGIAFMKSSFPFHFAVHLADELCADAKKELGRRTGFSFHKIQGSFVRSYGDIIERELTPHGGLSFKYGPYTLEKAETLRTQVRDILRAEAPASGVRKWLSLQFEDSNEAGMWMERVIEISGDSAGSLDLANACSDGKTHLYDVMSLASVMKKGSEQ